MEDAGEGQDQHNGNALHEQGVHELLGALAAASTADKRVICLDALDTYLVRARDDGGAVADAEAIAPALKAQLKNANQFVVSKALAVTATFAQSLATEAAAHSGEHGVVHHIRASIHALLASLVERLADHRDKSREVARAALIDLARAAAEASPAQTSHIASHAHNETPLATLQRLLTEVGLNAKSAKVKEQAILLLPHLRQAVPRLQLRPFLSALVEHLGDADPHVREASRATCIALFSTASPVAKAELKKEMDKHAVRKQTADAILAEVLTTESVVSEAPKVRHPSTGHATPASSSYAQTHEHQRSTTASSTVVANDVSPVYIASRGDLDRAFIAMEPHFAGKETENNWLAREHDIVKIRGMIKTSVPLSFIDTFVPHIKHMQESILKAASSLRTTLSVHGLALIEELAACLADDMDSLADGFFGPLLKMASSTKKLVVIKSQQAAKSILVNVSFKHKFLDLLWQTLQDKNTSPRISACQHLTTSLQAHATHRRGAFEHHGGLDIISNFCKRALPDQNKDVRLYAREAFYQIEEIWPDVAHAILLSLDAATRKQVETGRGVAPPSRLPSTTSTVRSEVRSSTVVPRVAATASVTKAPGTPGRASDAILAAKRAAAQRLAQERRRQQELEKQMQDAQLVYNDEEYVEGEASPPLPPQVLSVETSVSSAKRSSSPSLPQTPTRAPHSPVSPSKSASSSSRIPMPLSPGPSSARRAYPRTSSPVRPTKAPSAASSHSPAASEAQGGISQRLNRQEGSADSQGSAIEPAHPSNGHASPAHEAVLGSADTAASGQTETNEIHIDPHTPPKTTRAKADTGGPKENKKSTSTAVKWFLGKASRLDNVGADEDSRALVNASPSKQRPDSAEHIADLQRCTPTLRTFKSLVTLSKEFKLPENDDAEVNGTALGLIPRASASQLQRAMTMWQHDELFTTLFDAVHSYLDKVPGARSTMSSENPAKLHLERDKTREVHTAALVLLHRLVENQFALITSFDRERPLLEVLMKVVCGSEATNRTSTASTLKSGCQATLEVWTKHADPIVGLSLIRSLLLADVRERLPISSDSDAQSPSSTIPSSVVPKWVLGLNGFGCLLCRLPLEVVEDQLIRCRDPIKFALDDGHIELRQQAVTALVKANKALQDPGGLFYIMSPLDQKQEDLIMYYINKG